MRLLSLRSVLAATGLDAPTNGVIDTGCRLAAAAGAALHVVHVLPTDADDASRADALARTKQKVASAVVPTADARAHVLTGSPDEAILELADRVSADVIVLGRPKHGSWQQNNASTVGTAYAVAARAFAPCLVVVHPLRLPLERILVPVDLSDTARGALLTGLSWASALRPRGSDQHMTLVALHACPSALGQKETAANDDALAKELDAIRSYAGEWAGVSVRSSVSAGENVPDTIVRQANTERPDLVVLGTRGLGLDPVERLGSVSLAVLDRLEGPALLVPPAVWRAFAEERRPRAANDPPRLDQAGHSS
jgi:nucleotide-binding universal stress UspA family protein